MNGREVLRRAKPYAKKRGPGYRYDRGKGKGSHGQLYVGGRRTTVKRSELSKAMLKELGMKEDF